MERPHPLGAGALGGHRVRRSSARTTVDSDEDGDVGDRLQLAEQVGTGRSAIGNSANPLYL